MSFDLMEEEKQIFDLLRLEGCCVRCCLRFGGCKNVKQYQDIAELEKLEHDSDIKKEKDTEEPPCIACFGILQLEVEKTVIERITEEVEAQSYDCTTFTCALTIPVSLCLRERALFICIAKKLNLTEDAFNSIKYRAQNIKDVWKWVVLPKLMDTIGKRADLTTPSPFLLEICFSYIYDEMECCAFLDKIENINDKSLERKRKHDNTRYSRKRIESAMTDTSDELFEIYYSLPPKMPTLYVQIGNVSCSHTSIFIGGRYNKLSRQLSQTPWFINGEKKMETSVQDILCEPIAKAVKAESIKFLSSGREDVDVRNIHSGRPFAVELINPRITNVTPELLSNLVTFINNSSTQAKITTHLKLLSRDDLKRLKEGENVKTKFYRAFCVCRNPPQDASCLDKLNKLKNVKIIQKTPVRVLHRRPLTPRERFIYDMRARWAKPQELKHLANITSDTDNMFFVLDVKTQAGTYVKEFVHGDFGRTKPSLCDLLNVEVDIVALDVTGINLSWP